MTGETDVVSLLLQGGPFAIVLVLIIVGLLVPKNTLAAALDDRDEWREAYKASQAALETRTAALVAADERARVAQELAQTATQMLGDIRRLPGRQLPEVPT